MVKNKFKNRKGMTLVELLVGIVIFTTVIGITYGIYFNNVKHINKEQIRTTLQNEAQVIDSTFLQLSMQSEGIIKSKLTNSEEFKAVDFIDMKYRDEDNIDKYMRWKLEDKSLKIQLIDSYDKNQEYQIISNEYLLSENVEYFNIKSIDKKSLENCKIINIKIGLEKSNGFSTVEYPLSIIVTFRNKI